MPRILTLIYQHKYLNKINKRNNTSDEFKFRNKIVYIHYDPKNSKKELTLQMFCTDHNIPHVSVRDANHCATLLKVIAKGEIHETFIDGKCNTQITKK